MHQFNNKNIFFELVQNASAFSFVLLSLVPLVVTLGDNAVKVFDVGPGNGPKDADDKGLNEQVLKKNNTGYS